MFPLAAFRQRPGALLALLTIALLASGAERSAADALGLQLTPATQSVPPNTEFEVKLRVTHAGASFNGFTALVLFDPAMLTPVRLSPLQQQVDSLMSSVCSSLWHKFRLGGGVDSIHVSMLCEGAAASGAGPLYRLRFRTGPNPGLTGLWFGPGLEFANAGIHVPAVASGGAIIGIGVPVPTLQVEEDPAADVTSLRVSPNPATRESRIDFGRPLRGRASVRVTDLAGRVVTWSTTEPGARLWSWAGLDRAGARVPPGLYFIEVREGSSVLRARVSRLD